MAGAAAGAAAVAAPGTDAAGAGCKREPVADDGDWAWAAPANTAAVNASRTGERDEIRKRVRL